MHQNKNKEKVKNSEIRYLPDLYIFNKIKMATKLIIKNILMNEIVCSSMKMARNLIIKNILMYEIVCSSMKMARNLIIKKY